MNSFSSFLGGQFNPVKGGQLRPVLHGQFKPEKGGQLHRILQNDTTIVLSPAEIQTSTDNYLHDFPLTSTTLSINGSDFSMTHHGTGLMNGTLDLADPILTLHAVPDGCSTCTPKDFIFIIRSQSATELILDIFDEDQGSSTYAHLTFTK